MAKAASPVRLQAALMEAADAAGNLLHRSAAQQVEYWADIGRRVAGSLSPDALLELTSGLARVRIERVESQPVDVDAVFAGLERDRRKGALAATVSQAPVRYQACAAHPGYLERINADGTVTVGRFQGGKFKARRR